MTRIALFLTAIPLAVALAMLLNALLDRRLAAVTQTVRRTSSSRLSGFLSLLALAGLIAAPASAAQAGNARETACATYECALETDAERVERLWRKTQRGVVLVAQSRIPVIVDTVEPAGDDERPSPSGAIAESNDLDGERAPAER